MKNLKYGAVGLFALGAIALATAFALNRGGGNDDRIPAAPSPTVATTAAAPANTATARPTATPTPPPTPTPYNGKILRFKMPRFNLDAPLEELAINGRGELDTPRAENTAVGWYYIYDKPGRTNPDNAGWAEFGAKPRGDFTFKGNAIFSAHVYYRNVPAPFVNLAKAKDGDEVVVVMEDGRDYRYRVVSNKRYHRDTIPMAQIIWPAEKPTDKEWITLITCGGELDSTGQEYVSRDVIVAERVE